MDISTRLTIAEWQADYWQHLAQSRPPRFWWTWPRWSRPISISGDERLRSVLLIGPLAIALRFCECEDCQAERARTRDRLDNPWTLDVVLGRNEA